MRHFLYPAYWIYYIRMRGLTVPIGIAFVVGIAVGVAIERWN